MDFSVSDELGDGYPLVRCCRPLVSSLSLRSILAPQVSGPQTLSLTFQLQQQVYISICPTINLIDSSETELHN